MHQAPLPHSIHPTGIDGDEQVRRAVGTLGYQALDELVGLGIDDFDRNARLSGEEPVDLRVSADKQREDS